MTSLELAYKDPADLKVRTPRTHNAKQVKQGAASIASGF
jgi:hypothetical protein